MTINTDDPKSLEEQDSLYYGSETYSAKDIPQFTSGKLIFQELENQTKKKKLLTEVLVGPKNIVQFARELFPEAVKTNNIGDECTSDFKFWEEGQNDVYIELDEDSTSGGKGGADVYIGGPAALFGATIQSQSADSKNVVYCHDGHRRISNWKGSSSYFHIRDSMPVYHWPDNHGVYVMAVTLKHALQRRLRYKSYINQITSDPNWNKLRVCYGDIIRKPGVLKMMVKNQLYAFYNIGIHMKGTALAPLEKKTAYMAVHHAHLTHRILDDMKMKDKMLMTSNERSRTLNFHMGGGKVLANYVLPHLRGLVGDMVEWTDQTKEQIEGRGYDPEFVTQSMHFPRDGYFKPSIDLDMEQMITEAGGEVKGQHQLRKILVCPTDNGNDIKVTRIILEDTKSGKMSAVKVNSLHLSLGPSMKKLLLKDPGNNISSKMMNMLRGDKNLIQHIMWASGSSAVTIVKIDKDLVSPVQITKFRDHIDSHNTHIIRLAEKEVKVEDKTYQVFIMQTTGGGHFPNKNIHPEATLNSIRSKLVPLLRMNDKGIEYDVLSVRSCARGVTAANCFRSAAPAANMVMLYGIGGIGMTIMVPNALLMKALLKQRMMLSEGLITDTQFRENLKTSSFDEIPHWKHENPFERNYLQTLDKTYKSIAQRSSFKRPLPVTSNTKNTNKSLIGSLTNLKRAARMFKV